MGSVETLTVGLQIADHLRDHGDQLTHHLVDVPWGQLALLTEAVATIAIRRERLLRLRQDLRQQRRNLADDLADILWRQLSLTETLLTEAEAGTELAHLRTIRGLAET